MRAARAGGQDEDEGQDGMIEGKNDENPVEPTLEPLLQAHIGKQLRNMYDAMTREPVPERFKLLLDRLEAGDEPRRPPRKWRNPSPGRTRPAPYE